MAEVHGGRTFGPGRPGKCADCNFWHGNETYGTCRAHPPAILYIRNEEGAGYPETHWPWTNSNDWCGEFAPRPGVGSDVMTATEVQRRKGEAA